MPTAWASSPEETRPCFSVVRILRRFSSASADRIADMGIGLPPNYFKFS